MYVQLRYNFRVTPDATQRTALAQAFGCARVVLNDGLRLRQQAREAGEKYLSDGDRGPGLAGGGVGGGVAAGPRGAAGRYFASFVVQTTDDETLPPVDSEIGIDLGLRGFAVMSDGVKVTAPNFLRRAARELRRLQQVLSRQQKGSNRRKKAVVQVARAHPRVVDTRLHKLSTAIIGENQAVYVEDLCVVGLGRTRPAKSVRDAGWAGFTTMLEYKAARNVF